jgi:hypothetical protein
MTMIFKRAGAFAGWRGFWLTLRGRGDWPGPGFDILVVAHINPGRVWQESGKPGY